jgi:HAAS domain-containing protein
VNRSDTRISSYLDDLARMLADLDPGDRDEVLAGVREHLEATLAEHPDDPAAVDAALLRLGPPERVAAEARAELAPAPVSAPPATGTRGPLLVGAALVLTSVSALLPLVLALWTRADGLIAPESRGGGLFGPFAAEVLFIALLLSPVWVVALVCTLSAHDRFGTAGRDLALAGPVAFVAVAVSSLWTAPETLSGVGAVVLSLAAMAWVVRSVSRARRAAAGVRAP